MPSVASELLSSILPARPQVSGNVSGTRNRAEADREPATPFADLLDNAPAESAPRQSRSDRAERSDRADSARAANDRADARSAEAQSAQDSADARSAQDSRDSSDAQSAQDSSSAKSANDSADAKSANDKADGKASDAGDSKHADGAGEAKTQDNQDTTQNTQGTTATTAGQVATDAKTAAAGQQIKDLEAALSAEAGGKPKEKGQDADPSAAADATAAIAATPTVTAAPAAAVAVALPVVLATAAPAGAVTPATTDGAPDVDALAALAAAGQGGPRIAPDAAKPGQTQGKTEGDKSADAPAKGAKSDAPVKGATAFDPQTAVPAIDTVKDGQARGDGDKTGEFRQTADLLAKLGTAAPAPQGGGDATGAAKSGADAAQNLGGLTPANTANAAANPASAAANAPAQSQAQAQAAAVPLSGLAVEITSQAHAGKSHFEIRLDPADLGRIDVKLDVDGNGNVTTRLVVERADTLDLLKRDSASLERALQDAGLKTSDNALQFSLRQHTSSQDNTPGQSGPRVILSDDDPAPLEAMRQGYGRLLGLSGGLDIRV